MNPWVELLYNILSGTGEILIDKFFWIVVALVAVQHWRIAKSRENFFGIRGGSIFLDTMYSTGIGVVGGLLGSCLLVLTGVSLEGIGINYLWPLALFLLLISPRFLCFAYAGGIMALSSLLLGYPRAVEVPQLMALVAILHMVESFLILFSGHRGATPIYTKSETTEAVVGGFTLQKFWPIPLMALMVLAPDVNENNVTFAMSWWPLFKSGGVGPFGFVAVLAALGYGDLAIARTPKQKSRISARNLSIYSLVLLGLALLSVKVTFVQYIAALFSPLGHELVIYLGQKIELRQRPVFVQSAQGVTVLDVVANTLAHKLGIKPGDIIYTVNGEKVKSKYELENILAYGDRYLEVEFLDHQRNKWIRRNGLLRAGASFGIIPVPEGHEMSYMEINNNGALLKLWQKLMH